MHLLKKLIGLWGLGFMVAANEGGDGDAGAELDPDG